MSHYSSWPYVYTYPNHCSGCRCFSSTTTWQLTPTYVPRHRKPGPAH